MTFVSDLEPQELWRHFDKILTIPRGSKNEDEIRQNILEFAAEHDLEATSDDAGNLVIRKNATSKNKEARGVILQAHLDMVNEKNSDTDHDFEKDPIKPARQDGYLTAEGTTLGADNGIGLAAALAILENDSIQHGPLECLFTVDEETGLTGASALSEELLNGDLLINMDSEEEGAFYIGCAGGGGQDLSLQLKRIPTPANCKAMRVSAKGLKGGHSGIDIHLGRGNAIQLLARLLNLIRSEFVFHLFEFEGGNMHNAIPREASASFYIADNRVDQLREDLEKRFKELKSEYSSSDPNLEFSIEEEVESNSVFELTSQDSLVKLLFALPHGVLSMSRDIPDLVETSTNLATAKTSGNLLLVHCSSRSSSAAALDALQLRIEVIAELAGATVKRREGYPGWQPDLSSELLKVSKDAYRGLFDEEPEVKAIHAGLECGIIKEKYPHVDMISLGPQIEAPHSPDERVEVASVKNFYRLLTEILGKLA